MINNLTTDEIAKIIHAEKCRGKKTLKMKVQQIEFFKDKSPKVFLQTTGLSEVESYLKENGYSFEYEKSDKQVTVGYDMRGAINKYATRDLKTTNLIIKW
jgi:hypothetical protein